MSLSATDKDQDTSGVEKQNIIILNVAPTVVVSGPSSLNENRTATYAFNTTDPRTGNTFSVVGTPRPGKYYPEP